MRFEDLRKRSASAVLAPTPTASHGLPQRGHSVWPHARTPSSHLMTRNDTHPTEAPPSHIAPTKSPSDSVLPSVDKLFPRPDLATRMKKHLVRVANETSNALIRETLAQDDSSSKQWRPAQRLRGGSGNVNVLRGASRGTCDTLKDATCVRAVTDNVHASIEEFALLFKLDSSREAADHLLLFNADLVRHATLYTLVSPSGEQPRRYVGVKWVLVASPLRVFRNRDFCYLECQKEFTDPKGRRGWVRSLHSLNLPCCPSLEKEHGIVRASIYRSGLTAVETDEPGVLSVTYTVELDLKGRMALELLQPGFVAQRVAALATVDKLLQQQRLSSSPLLGDLDIPVKKRTRGSCNLCFRDFGAIGGLLAAITPVSTKSKRYVCRKCGENVCRRCSDDWRLDVPVVGRIKVRICTVCSAEAKQSHSSALTIRAGTCPVRVLMNESTTEVEGVTHPNLLDLPKRASRRSLSMLDRPSDLATFFAQQEEIKRDLAFRATELSRRVQIWDEMQKNNRDTSILSDKRQKEALQGRCERRTPRQVPGKRPLTPGPSSRSVGQEEEKEEPEAEVVPLYDQVRKTPRREKPEVSNNERHPSFLSLESSSTRASDQERDDLIRLSSEMGRQSSANFCDSIMSDYDELTIDGVGDIRTTTDVSRWWQGQQVISEASERRDSQAQHLLSPVTSLKSVGVDEMEAPIKMQQQFQNPRASVVTLNEKEQELAALYEKTQQLSIENRQKRTFSVQQRQQMQEFEEQARYHEEQARRRQQLDFEEMAQYQEKQLRLRNDPFESAGCLPEPLQQRAVQQPSQRRQKELENCHQHSRDDDRSSSSHFNIDLKTFEGAKEQYFQHQRQQQVGLAAERSKDARLNSKKALDQSFEEDVELMETSQGEWVPINEALARRAPSDFVLTGGLRRHDPEFMANVDRPST